MTYVKKMELTKVSFAEGHELYGLELVSRPVQIEFLAEVAALMSDIADVSGAGQAVDAQSAKSAMSRVAQMTPRLFELFASKIKSWNYQMETEDGEIVDVAPTVEGFRSIGDDRELFSILSGWLDAIGGVSVELGKESGSGETSPELSLPMEPLSASPETSSEQN